MKQLEIFLLGEKKVLLEGRCIDLQPTVLLLLSFLAVHPATPQTRDELAALFWANADDRHAKKSLNTSLWRLRKALVSTAVEEPFIVNAGRSEVALNQAAPTWCDAVLFEQTLLPLLDIDYSHLTPAHTAAMEHTLNYYRGDLLTGFYDDWVIRKREWLRTIRLRTLNHLVRFYTNHDAPQDVLRCGRLILEYDPLREDIYRHMMRACAALGETAAARQLYLQCTRELSAALNVAPLPETRQTFQQIRRDSARDGETALPTYKAVEVIRQELLEARELIRNALEQLNRL